jgi:hypothetical protein
MAGPDAILRRLGRAVPDRLALAIEVEAALGGTPFDGDPREIHPLVVALSIHDGDPMGLLVWPGAEANEPIPVVRQGPAGLHFHSASVDAWAHEGLGLLDANGGETIDNDLYAPGTLAATRLPLNAYVLLRVGAAPRHLEPLANAHLHRGDTEAALVTADRACRSAPGFARPHAFRADLLAQLGRTEEARDGARTALLEPVWTLGARFEPVAELAGWKPPFRADPFWQLARDESKPLLDRAAHVMDAIAAEGKPWSAARSEVAALYAKAGLDALANWIAAPD